MADKRWLWALGTAIFLIPLGLELGYIWQAGLDLHTPKNVRGYLELRRRGREDIAGKALWTEARQFNGPLTLLMPGDTGDRDLTARLTTYLVQHGHSTNDLTNNPEVRRRFFQAHAFALADLQTGTLKTLDGRAHQVVCGDAQRNRICMLNGLNTYGLNVYNYFSPFGKTADDGSLYIIPAQDPVRGDKGQSFFPFLDESK